MSAPLTAALFRREAFDRVGLLEEEFESYLEDVEFGMRCTLAGGWGLYVPGARCIHEGSPTLGVWSARTVRLIARNQILLLARHYPGSLLRRWWWPVFTGQGLWGVIAARHGRPLAWLTGKLAGLRAWRSLRRRALADPNCGAARDPRDLAEFVLSAELEIETLQAQTGTDTYWRLYFALT